MTSKPSGVADYLASPERAVALLNRVIAGGGNLKEIRQAVAAATRIVGSTSLRVSAADPSPLVHPKEAILDEASRWNADLIVVGSHGRGGIDRFLLGSVSEAVALHATCSVEIIRQKAL